jgi:CubicO group peptidase (beta-lactamase class C family)
MFSGSCYTYSFCTDFLGRVCEKVSGKSLEAFMKKALLDPLGMRDTHFVVPVACTLHGPRVLATTEVFQGTINRL